MPPELYVYEDATPAAWTVRVNGASVIVRTELGHAVLKRKWRTGDVVELDLPMPVRWIRAHPQIAATLGLVALERGPVLYCVEGETDRPGAIDMILCDAAVPVAEVHPGLLGGVTILNLGAAGEPPATAMPY